MGKVDTVMGPSVRVVLPKPTLELNEEIGSSATLKGLWVGAGAGALRLEICELVSRERPTNALLRHAWKKRRADRATPVIVYWAGADDEVLICGPSAADPDRAPVSQLDSATATTILRQSLSMPPQRVVPTILRLIDRAHGDGGIAGFQNRNLISTHCAAVSFRRDVPRWGSLVAIGRAASTHAGVELLRALGFGEAIAPGTFVVEHGGRTVVYATTLPEGTPFDRSPTSAGQDAATAVISEARKLHALRAVIVSGRLVRTYAVAQTESLDDIPTPATYSELDLDLLSDDHIGLLGLLASAEALKPNGAFEQILDESRIYNCELRQRFQRAVYDKVVGRLVTALWRAADKGARRTPNTILSAALLFLFRVLFLLYAEDRRLMPMYNVAYRRASLTEMLFRLKQTDDANGRFDAKASDHWQAIRLLCNAVGKGHVEWGVAEYDGGLFEEGTESAPEASLLKAVELTNASIAPILIDLAFDGKGLDRGKIDFWDIGVRYLGTLYEGLLAYSVRVADRDLKIVGDEYLPVNTGDVIDIRKGEPYLITPKGGRKVSGTYYTPNFVVRRLIDEALRPTLETHLERVGNLPAPERWAKMLDFRVVDPAMGSGHFLVDATDAIADRLAQYLEQNKDVDTTPILRARQHLEELNAAQGLDVHAEAIKDFDLFRRIVIKNCVYGVDIQPMAVELARLSLWLHTFVPGMPLSYLGHGLRCGNSLVGVVGDEVEDRFGGQIFESTVNKMLAAALEPARAIGAGGDLTMADIHESKKAQSALEAATADLDRAYDVYCCRGLVPGLDGQLNNPGFLEEIVKDATAQDRVSDVRDVILLAEQFAAFHWQLAYPEVFLRELPGFDVVIGNPPWEEITVERLGFYAGYQPGLKSIKSQAQQERIISEYEEAHPDVKATYEADLKRTEQMRTLVRSNFELARSGDPDLYRAFAELALRLSRDDGAIGMVYPRTLLSGDGMAPYRKALLPIAEVTLDFGLNKGGWIFEDAEPRYTIVALAARKNAAGIVRAAGPAVTEKAWSMMPDTRIPWSVDELAKATDGLEIPLIPDITSATLFRKMVANGQRFETALNGVSFRPWAPIHATNDRKSGLLKESGSGWPVYSGDNFDLWEPEVGKTAFTLTERLGIAQLNRKRQRSTVWKDVPQTILRDPKTLPQWRPHILFRDVTNRTNSRTVIAALVPPKRFATNKAPTLLRFGGTSLDEALRLAVMCSLPFDWCARRRVETNLNFFILKALPVPVVPLDDARARRAAMLAAKLSCIDDRFADFARECGVTTGALSVEQRNDAVAEIDALVAIMYGLGAPDLETVFSDFTQDAVPPKRRQQIRDHFKRLLG